MRPGIQLYTLREASDSVVDLIERVAETPFEGVQISGLGEDDPAEIADALDRTGVSVAGAHVGIDEIKSNREGIVDAYRTIGCTDLVVPSYDREAFDTEDGAQEAGRHLSEWADRLAGDGIDLHYHNHTFEFTPLDDRTAFDAFADAADGVDLEIDIGLASHGDADPIELLDRYGDRVSLVHLTDSRTGSEATLHVELGEGEVDLQGCVDAADEAGADSILFEHGLTNDPEASMERAAEVIETLLS